MVAPRKIEPEKYMVFSPDGKPYSVNEYEFNDLRLQIKKAKESGWTILTDDGEMHFIDINGKYEGSAFNQMLEQHFELF